MGSIADDNVAFGQLGGDIRRGDAFKREVDQPCKVLPWGEDGDAWDGAEGLIGVLAEGGDALIHPVKADVLNEPVEAGGEGFDGWGIEGSNFVALGALVGKIEAFVGAHVMLD